MSLDKSVATVLNRQLRPGISDEKLSDLADQP